MVFLGLPLAAASRKRSATRTCSRRGNRAAFALVTALLTPLPSLVLGQPVPGNPSAAKTLWLEGNGLKLKTSISESSKLSSHPVLVVVPHGDLLGLRMVSPTTCHYVFADEAAKRSARWPNGYGSSTV